MVTTGGGRMNEPDAKFVAEILNMVSDNNYTPDEIERNGYAYAFTELTDEEAQKVGAKAYLRRSK